MENHHCQLNNMSRQEHESAIIKSLYQSALNADCWSAALKHLCHYTGAEAGKLVLVDDQTSLVLFCAQVGIPFSTHQSGEVLIHCIPLLQTPDQTDIPGGCNWLFVKPVGYNTDEWLKSLMTELSERVRRVREAPSFAWLILQNPSFSSGDFQWIDAGLMSLLKVHIRLALLLFGKTSVTLKHNQLEVEILNHLKIGIACVNQAGATAYCNLAFADMVNSGDGLFSHDGFISMTSDSRCSFFRQMADAAIDQRLSGIRIIARPSGKRAYQVCFRPLPGSIRNLAGEPVYLLFLFDPEITSNSLPDLMELAYDLTKTEAKLTVQMCRGLSAEDYAEQENVSVATARTQLRSVYTRTKTRGLVKLANLVRGLELLTPPENLEKKSRKKVVRNNALTAQSLLALYQEQRRRQ